MPSQAAPYFPYCNTSEGLQSVVTAMMDNYHDDTHVVCHQLGLCNATTTVEGQRKHSQALKPPTDACGGPCSSSSQCGPGCYCNGYGQCDDGCSPACQGEQQFCPQGCGCGDYGFCDAD